MRNGGDLPLYVIPNDHNKIREINPIYWRAYNTKLTKVNIIHLFYNINRSEHKFHS